MRRTLAGLALALLQMPVVASDTSPPAWAFPGCVRAAVTATPAPGAQPRMLRVPGSTRQASAADIKNWTVTVDWFPTEHEPLPAILAASRSPTQPACGYCHLPDGSGRPENAKVAGLPAAYIVAQVKALHTGQRQAAVKDWLPTSLMRAATADISDADLTAAAQYFSRQPVRSFVRVDESGAVPTHGAACFLLAAAMPATPVGDAIVEIPGDMERFEARDPHTPYVAYVPPGSLARGRSLAQGGRTVACAVCHGPGLRGGADLPGPPLAGRFPTYLFRQLYGFRSGARTGAAASLMQGVTAALSDSDFIDLAAYAASLPP